MGSISGFARTCIAIVLGGVVLLGVAIGQISNVIGAFPAIETTGSWLSHRLVEGDGEGRRLSVSGYGLLCFVLILMAILVAAMARIRRSQGGHGPGATSSNGAGGEGAVKDLSDRLAAASDEKANLEQELELEISSSRDIIALLIDAGPPRQYRFHSVEFEHIISKNGDTAIRRKLTISTEKGAGFLLRLNEYGDEESTPIKTFHDLGMQVSDSRGSAPLLKSLNTDYLIKRFVIAFRQKLSPKTQTTLTFDFTWPGYFKRALDFGRTDYEIRYVTTNKTNDTRFRCVFRLKPDAPKLTFQSTGKGLGLCEPSVSTDPLNGETVWEFVKDDFDSRESIAFIVARARLDS